MSDFQRHAVVDPETRYCTRFIIGYIAIEGYEVVPVPDGVDATDEWRYLADGTWVEPYYDPDEPPYEPPPEEPPVQWAMPETTS